MTNLNADQKFFEDKRKLSPQFPDILSAYERRQRDRENLAARILLWGFVPVGLLSLFWSTFGWVIAGFGLVGFLTTCYVAGARMTKREGGRGGRPF